MTQMVCLFIAIVMLAPSWAAADNQGSKPSLATEASISLVDGIAVDSEGNVYISRRAHNAVDRIDTKGHISRYAGDGTYGYGGDGGPATQAQLRKPAGLTVDAKGNLYIADRESHRVRKVDTQGNITTIAGTGVAGFSGDGQAATQAQLNLPSGVALGPKGNLYIADRSNDRIRKIDTKGIITTVAGNGTDGFSGDSGPATQAQLSKPFGIDLDAKGNLYIADRGNNRVRRVDAHGFITTVAGDGGFFFIGDNGPAYRASVAGPTGVVVGKDGTFYIADRNNNRIRAVDSLGMIRTVVGTGQQDYNGDSEVARETNLHLPFGVALDPKGRLLVIDRSNYRIRRVALNTGQVTTIAGNGEKKFQGDGGPATGAGLSFPHGIVADDQNNVIFSDKANNRLRRVDTQGIIDTVAGNGTRGTLGNEGPALEAAILNPTTLIRSEKGELYFISPSGYMSVVRRIDTKGIIHNVMSTGDLDYQKTLKSEKSQGRSQWDQRSMVTQVSDIDLDSKGNLIWVDRINHVIRRMDTKGKFKTIGGTGDSDFYGDGGHMSKAAFRDPGALVIDDKDNIYIADAANNRIRKIDAKGIVSTYAGTGDHNDHGDGGPALKAGIRQMDDLVISPAGELHIVGSNSHVIRKITKDGKIETVAGRAGVQGYFGDGGPATKAMLKNPAAAAFDSEGNMYISDMGNNRIRKVDTKGVITTLAGNGAYGWGSEGEEVNIYFQNFP